MRQGVYNSWHRPQEDHKEACIWHRISAEFIVLFTLKFHFNCWLTPHTSHTLLGPAVGPLAVVARCDYVYLLSPVCDKGAAYVCIMQSALGLCVSVWRWLGYLVMTRRSRQRREIASGSRSRRRSGEEEASKAATYFVQTTPCCWGVCNVAVDIY